MESALQGENGCRRAAIGSAVSEPGSGGKKSFEGTQPNKSQIGNVGILRNEANRIVRAGTENANMLEVECLMSLFVPTVMRNELLSSMHPWHPIMQIIRNDDAEAKKVAG